MYQVRMSQINMNLWLSAPWCKEFLKSRQDIVIFFWNRLFSFEPVSNLKDIWLQKKKTEVIF